MVRIQHCPVHTVVTHAQNDRCGLGPIETINSGHNDAVVNALNNR